MVLFSATTNQDVLTIAWKYQHDPIEVTVEATKQDRPQIAQYVISTEQNKKIDHLLYLLDADVYQRVMIFCNTKFMTDRLTERLKKEGYQAECIHGDVKQSQRNGHERLPARKIPHSDCDGRRRASMTWRQSSILICPPKNFDSYRPNRARTSTAWQASRWSFQRACAWTKDSQIT